MTTAKVISTYTKAGVVVGVQLEYPDGRKADAYIVEVIKAMQTNNLVLTNARVSLDGEHLVSVKTGTII